MIRYVRSFVVVCLTVIAVDAGAQIKLIPIQKPTSKNNTARTSSTDGRAPFPLWEDFSTSVGTPDTCKWINSTGVWINDGGGINKPSINVATFDGNDGNGNAYSADPFDVGYTDSLVSRPIDLTQVPAGFENSVYLKFFYQREGNGEFPDDVDFIEVQFRDVDSLWNTIWPPSPADLDTATSTFHLVSLQVDPAKYFHENFQFRFRSFGRRAGPYDTWHIDYIYLDKDQDGSSIEIADRAITAGPQSVFSGYTAIPARQFRTYDQSILQPTEIELYNYQTSLLVQAFEYSAFITDLSNNTVIDTLVDKAARTILGGGTETLAAPAPDFQLLQDAIVNDTIPLNFSLDFIVNTGDTLLINTIDPIAGDTTYHDDISLRVNDTVRREFTIHDYYAYDDGSAEFGAGINQKSGQLVYQYVLTDPDTLVALDMYFTSIGRLVAGTPIELIVLSDLDDNASSVLYSGVQTIQNTGAINRFGTYNIEPLVVRDTIYIGFIQNNDNFIPLGFDKNTDSGSRIHFNVTGVWEQNTELKGSLMLRPKFGKGDLITSIESDLEEKLSIFPNPAHDQLTISGKIDHLEVISLEGRSMPVITLENSKGKTVLETSGYRNGIYIIRFLSDRKWLTRKVIISH